MQAARLATRQRLLRTSQSLHRARIARIVGKHASRSTRVARSGLGQQQAPSSRIHTLHLHKKLPEETMEVVNATAPVVAANIDKITRAFYPTMFKNNPEVLNYFNQSNQHSSRQPNALADSVLAAVGHVQDLAGIAPALERIGHKHCALGVLPEHYAIVHDNFLDAVVQVLGSAVTPEVGAAWSQVLNHVSDACIETEKQLYEEAAQRPGNWLGHEAKEFVVAKTVNETATVKSLYLKRADGAPAPSFTPGQYVTVHVPSDGPFAPRHYTVSSHKHFDGAIRISVRHLTGVSGHPDGVASSYIHELREGDSLMVRPPFGTFTRDYMHPQDSRQEVYVTAGIGITCAAAMMPLAKAAGNRVAHVHSGRGPHRHAFRAELDNMADFEIYNYDGGHPSHFLDFEKVLGELENSNFTPREQCVFMVCGPAGFWQAAAKALKAYGVPDEYVHYEAFGPAVRLEEDEE